MLRHLYALTIRLHPRAFRERYGNEMLGIFDDSAGHGSRTWLVADAARSAFRQHVLRPHHEDATASLPPSPDGVPLFAAVDTSRPSSWMLWHGCVMTVAAWCALTLVMRGGSVRGPSLLGLPYIGDSRLRMSHTQVRWDQGRSGVGTRTVWSKVLSMLGTTKSPDAAPQGTRASIPLTTAPTAKQRATSKGPRLLMPRRVVRGGSGAIEIPLYSRLVGLELARSPLALQGLDTNNDGRVTAEECGVADLAGTSSVFSVLDTDRNGELSANEIARAAVRLRVVDRNNDGRLSRAELF